MTVAKLIADARKKSGLSLDRLAAKAGVHRSTIYAIETGERDGGFDKVVRLLIALKVPLKTAADMSLASPARDA